MSMIERLRAARGVTAAAVNGADMDAAIRSAAGRESKPPPNSEPHPSATDAQREAAEFAGLPLEHAHRLGGADGPAMVRDARAFRAQLEAAGSPVPVLAGFDGGARGGADRGPDPADMSAQIRQGAHNRKAFGGTVPLSEREFIPTDRSMF